VARFPHQAALATRLGAARVLPHRPARALVEAVGAETGAELLEPWRGLPMLNGGVDIVYDTVTSPETLEVGVRITRSRGKIVALGVEPPRRFEWTPLYFKEIALVGSNAFGVEEVDGRRRHAIEWYLDWARTGRIDATAILTHRFALADWQQAFLALADPASSGAVKVLFAF
jgi:threonine dehydrogenase-like Zn-dependent dehydrogenase